MKKHRLYTLYFSICANLVIDHDELLAYKDEALATLAKKLNIDPDKLPRALHALVVGDSAAYAVDESIIDELVCGCSIDNAEIFKDPTVRGGFLDGAILVERLRGESEASLYSGYGTITFVINADETRWIENEWINIGAHNYKLVSCEDFESEMTMTEDEYIKYIESDDEETRHPEPEEFYRNLSALAESGFYIFIDAIGEVEHACFFSFDNPCKYLSVAFILSLNKAEGSSEVVIDSRPFLELFTYYDCDHMIQLDRCLVTIVEKLKQNEFLPKMRVHHNAFSVGTCFQQLFWFEGEAITNEKTGGAISANLLARHLKKIGTTSLSRNSLISIVNGSHLTYAISAFNQYNICVAKFQIEFYSNEGVDTFQEWLDEVLSLSGVDSISVSNEWEFQWHFEEVTVHPKSFEDMLFTKFSSVKKSPVQVAGFTFFCEGMDNYEFNMDQTPIKWLLGDNVASHKVEAFITPLLLIPTDIAENIHVRIKNGIEQQFYGNFPTEEEFLSVCEETRKLTAQHLQASPDGSPYQFTVFVVLNTSNREMFELLNAVTSSEFFDDENSVGNAILAQHFSKEIGDHYNLKGVRGAYAYSTYVYEDM